MYRFSGAVVGFYKLYEWEGMEVRIIKDSMEDRWKSFFKYSQGKEKWPA
jgi:hypothetical protein